MSYDIERFEVVNIETSMFGVLVVVSRIDKIPSSVIEGVTGELVDPCDKMEYLVNPILRGANEILR